LNRSRFLPKRSQLQSFSSRQLQSPIVSILACGAGLNVPRTAKRLQRALLASFCCAALTGCVTTKILDPTTDPQPVQRNVPFTPPADGYFIPESTMLRILDRLSEKDVFGK
jgi:hypothetical protein